MITTRYVLARVTVAVAATLLLAAGVAILLATAARNPLGDAFCIAAAILGIFWVVFAANRRRRRASH
jgi:phosphate/sulfate permease